MRRNSRRQSGRERIFTVELNSSSDLKRVSVPDGNQRILLEGTIGILIHTGFVEGSILEIAGTNGVLRIDLAQEDLARLGSRGDDR
jgi:hypothetical protein